MKISGCKKLFSVVFSIVLIFTVIPTAVYAAAPSIGMDIDTYEQGYIDDRNGSWSGISAELVTDSQYTNGGQSLKLSYQSQGACATFTNGHWNSEIATAGYSGIRFWVYNPEQDDIYITMVLTGSDNISVPEGARYYTCSDDSFWEYVPKTATKQYTVGWGDNLGEVKVNAGYKGWIYIPFSSITPSPASVGFYRFHVFNSSGNTGILYYDDFSLFAEDFSSIESMIPKSIGMDIDDYQQGYIDERNSRPEFTSNMVLSLTTDADKTAGGQGLRLDYSGQYANITFSNGYWNAPVSTYGYTGVKFWIYNPSEDTVKFMLIPDDGSIRISYGSTYYKTNVITGVTTKNNVEDVEWGNCGQIDITPGFKGWIYIPFTSMIHTETNQQVTPDIMGMYRFNLEDTGDNAGTIYYDSFMLYNENPMSVSLGGNIDGFSQGYIDALNAEWSDVDVSIVTDEDLTAGGQALSFSYNYQSYGAGISFTNGDWHHGESLAGSAGVRFWVYNPEDTAVRFAFVPNHNNDNTLKRGAKYFAKDINTGKIQEMYTVEDDLAAIGVPEGRFGEIVIDAGFKGWIYIPLSAFYSVPESISIYRAVVFSADQSNGVFYFDALQSYTRNDLFVGGDANMDNAINILDLVRVKKIVANVTDATLKGDIDGNGVINASDLVLIRKYLLA